jgi:uncharacterized membrane protein
MISSFVRSSFLARFYSDRSGLDRSLLLSCGFSMLLLLTRVLYTGNFMFCFLVWNLFLAYLPYKISGGLMRHPQWIEHKWKFGLLVGAWLLLLPNSFYIITDLFHLESGGVLPVWFDLALIISFAWNGLMLGVGSMKQMEIIIKLRWNISGDWFYVYPVMFLNALGIYIGRYLRYNSWDVFTNPFELAGEMFYLLLHPVQNRFDWSMILCYSLLLSLFYVTVKKLAEAK